MKDSIIKKLIEKEDRRQKEVINLIASENYVSSDVLEALGSTLTNKYSEGYPGRRYYGGNEVIDEIEMLAKERALALFGLNDKKWHVNVQPLSGSPANLAVFVALVPLGGKIMGLKLSSGGHLTHGQSVSFTGKAWKQIPFEVDGVTEMLNYKELEKLALLEKPDIIIAGFTAYPRVVDFKKFAAIAKKSGSLLMVDMSHLAGLIAGGVYPSPFPYADVVTTTVHKTLRGPRSAMIFVKKDTRGMDIKIDKAIIPGLFGGPHNNQIAAVAVALQEANTKAFKKYAAQVVKNAIALSNALVKLGMRVVTKGTDSHLLLVDTWVNGSGISGKDASERLEKAGIIVNMNTIPQDPRGVMDPSGIRIGTAAVTTLGMKEKDMKNIAEKIVQVLTR